MDAVHATLLHHMFTLLCIFSLLQSADTRPSVYPPSRVKATALVDNAGPAVWHINDTVDANVSTELMDGRSLPIGSDVSGKVIPLRPGYSFRLNVTFATLAFQMLRARTSFIGMDVYQHHSGDVVQSSAVWRANLDRGSGWRTLSELSAKQLKSNVELNFSVPYDSRAFLLDFIGIYPQLPDVLPEVVYAYTYRKWGSKGFSIGTPGNQGTALDFYDDVDVYASRSLNGVHSAYAIRLNKDDDWVRYDVYVPEEDYYTAHLRVRNNASVSCNWSDVACRWRTAGLAVYSQREDQLLHFAPLVYLSDPSFDTWQIATAKPEIHLPSGFNELILYAYNGEYFLDSIEFERGFPFLNLPGTIESVSFRKFGPWGYGFHSTPASATPGFQGNASEWSNWALDVYYLNSGDHVIQMHAGEWIRFDVYMQANVSDAMEVQIAGWLDKDAMQDDSKDAYFILGLQKPDSSVEIITQPIQLASAASDDSGFGYWCSELNGTIPSGPQELIVFGGLGFYKFANFSIVPLDRASPFPFPLCARGDEGTDGSSGGVQSPSPAPPQQPSYVNDSLHSPRRYTLPAEGINVTAAQSVKLVDGQDLKNFSSRISYADEYGYQLTLRSLEQVTFDVVVPERMLVNVRTTVQSDNGGRLTLKVVSEANGDTYQPLFDLSWSNGSFNDIVWRDIPLDTGTKQITFINSQFHQDDPVVRLTGISVLRKELTTSPCRLNAAESLQSRSQAGGGEVVALGAGESNMNVRVMAPDDAVWAYVNTQYGRIGKIRLKMVQLDCCGQCLFNVALTGSRGSRVSATLRHYGTGARKWAIATSDVGTDFGAGRVGVSVQMQTRSVRCLLHGIELSGPEGSLWPSTESEWLGYDAGESTAHHAAHAVPAAFSAELYRWWSFDGHGGKERWRNNRLPINAGTLMHVPGAADVFSGPGGQGASVLLKQNEWIVYDVDVSDVLRQHGANITALVQPQCESGCSVTIRIQSLSKDVNQKWKVDSLLAQLSTQYNKASSSASWIELSDSVSSSLIQTGKQPWRMKMTTGPAVLVASMRIHALNSKDDEVDHPKRNNTHSWPRRGGESSPPEAPPSPRESKNATTSTASTNYGTSAQALFSAIEEGEETAIAILALIVAGFLALVGSAIIAYWNRWVQRHARTDRYRAKDTRRQIDRPNPEVELSDEDDRFEDATDDTSSRDEDDDSSIP